MVKSLGAGLQEASKVHDCLVLRGDLQYVETTLVRTLHSPWKRRAYLVCNRRVFCLRIGHSLLAGVETVCSCTPHLVGVVRTRRKNIRSRRNDPSVFVLQSRPATQPRGGFLPMGRPSCSPVVHSTRVFGDGNQRSYLTVHYTCYCMAPRSAGSRGLWSFKPSDFWGFDMPETGFGRAWYTV